MGYFSNGTEGEMYEEEYCSKCIHERPGVETCAVLQAHLIYNYDECNKKDSILHMLIPRDGCENLKCKMYYPRNAPHNPHTGARKKNPQGKLGLVI